MYKNLIKFVLDFFISIILFMILLPVFIVVTLLLFFANDGKSFFFQLRPGKNGVPFKVIKFRTMNEKKDKYGNLLSDGQRLTTIGKIIRATSLDEIPQLINVIKGDMSLVGPRPLLMEYLPLYNSFQKRRHEVRPGITGWAQVNGRNAIGWGRKFNYDVWYVDHVNFVLDTKIMWLTVARIFKSEGINSQTSETMEKFTGNI
jgi:lipopolysaccharide/colanic/teichoic acid biosynthesis glycosyltransferase